MQCYPSPEINDNAPSQCGKVIARCGLPLDLMERRGIIMLAQVYSCACAPPSAGQRTAWYKPARCPLSRGIWSSSWRRMSALVRFQPGPLLTVERHYGTFRWEERSQICRTLDAAHLSGPEGRTLHAAPARHMGGSGGGYDLPRRYLAENCLH